MIELKQIAYQIGQFQLSNLSLVIPTGQYAVLMGQTGQGKTTLVEIICGLRKPSAGRVLVQGQDVTDWLPGDRHIGYLPQDLALFPHMRVVDHLSFALRLRRQSPTMIQSRVNELAEVLGLTHLLTRQVQGLSGGEAQRVALGRAIAFRPAVLLLDEPLSALDEQTRGEMHALLRQLKVSTGMTTLHITHNSEDAAALADRQYRLAQGQIIETVHAPNTETHHAS